MSKAVKAQLEVKTKCELMQQSLKDLYEWEKEIKQKESQSFQRMSEEKLSPPVRSHAEEMNKFTKDQYATEKKRIVSGPIPVGDLKEAEQYYERGNEFSKRAKEGGESFTYGEQYNQYAIEMYTNAIQLNNRVPVYYVNRAFCYFNLERYEECITDCNNAIELDNDNTKAYYRRMNAFESMGNNELAYSDCQKILQISKDAKEQAATKQSIERISQRLKQEADKCKTLGNKHLNNKDYEKALDCFTQAIAKYGGDAIYFHNRSLCYFHLKDFESCLEDCNKAIEINKDYFRPYYQRMRVRELRSEYPGAIYDCRKFLELVKDDKQRSTAEKDLERLQRALERDRLPKEYNWSELRKSASVINFVQKPSHLRSKKPLKRIPIAEITTSSDSNTTPPNYVIASNYEAIPDSVIDKIFNNNTGERLIEPKVSSNLENLFPSSSKSNKLKQFFSPPPTPSSPPNDLLLNSPSTVDATSKVDGKNGNPVKLQQNTSGTQQLSKEFLRLIPKEPENKDVTQLKQEKNRINQGNSPVEIEAENPATSVPSSFENPYPSIPSSTVKFYHTWNNLKTQEEKYVYLKSLQDAPLHKLLGANMSSQMLSDMLQVLERHFIPDNRSPLRILSEIAKNPQVGLLVLMLNDKDKYSMIKLFDFMDTLGDDKAQLQAIKKSLIV